MKSTLHQIKVGNLSWPKVVIVSSLHGDEIVGPIFVESLLKDLKTLAKRLKVHFVIFPFVNLDGIRSHTRIDPASKLDLNRCFAMKSPPFPIKFLKKNLKDSRLVIDIHCFPNTQHALTALFFKHSNNNGVSKMNLALVNSFKPEIIWQLDFENNDKEKNHSLGQWLTNLNIPNFAIETNSPEFLTLKEILSIKRKLVNAVTSFFIPPGRPVAKNAIFGKRRVIFSNREGIFIPSTEPLQKVQNGSQLGSITNLNFKRKAVISPTSGHVIFIKNPIFAHKGEKLVGVLEEEI